MPALIYDILKPASLAADSMNLLLEGSGEQGGFVQLGILNGFVCSRFLEFNLGEDKTSKRSAHRKVLGYVRNPYLLDTYFVISEVLVATYLLATTISKYFARSVLPALASPGEAAAQEHLRCALTNLDAAAGPATHMTIPKRCLSDPAHSWWTFQTSNASKLQHLTHQSYASSPNP